MARPTNKSELLESIDREFGILMTAVDSIPADRRADPGACDEWSVKDLLAHLDAWHRLFIGWHEWGQRGMKPPMPAEGYTWAETPELNADIWAKARDDSWDEVMGRLLDSKDAVVHAVERYGDEELFEKRRFPWTGSTSVGSYATSATSSHYQWAAKQIRAYARMF